MLIGAALAVEAGALALFFIGRGLSVAWLLHLAAVLLLGAGLLAAAAPDRAVALFPDWCPRRHRCRGRNRAGGAGRAPLAARHGPGGALVRRVAARPRSAPDVGGARLPPDLRRWHPPGADRSLVPDDAADRGAGPRRGGTRLPVALAGALGVGGIYLLARVLFDRRVAVVAAGLTIALTWHLNFSRIALPAVISLTCDTMAAALFVAGLKRESRLLLGLAGLVCGAGLYFYFTSQLMPFVLALVGAHQLLAHRFRLPSKGRGRAVRLRPRISGGARAVRPLRADSPGAVPCPGQRRQRHA